MSPAILRKTLFLLFAISGFTGLIYESIWSHYLKLFLGHAAYAQALVLAIFMGGMALGAWLTSNFATKYKNLLIAYAIVEGLIGVLGVTFHPLFNIILDITFNNILPALDSLFAIQIYKWGIAALLILPQSVLLGMTFPLMSNGLIRLYPDFQGGSLSMLYFTNSLGAAIGVLIAGFVLISSFGLPGTIMFAGIVNIFLAVIVYAISKGRSSGPSTVNYGNKITGFTFLLLIAAAITGMASFIYEIAWLRMLSMVLGASTHSFELMLSAFITGLAIGGLWIKKRIDHFTNPVFAAGVIQVIMSIFALLTVPLYNYTFDVMSFFMAALDKSDSGYTIFTLASHLIGFMVMLPATFCAGMTLPLFTKILLSNGYGEKSVGQVYAFNTLGAIAGIVVTIFLLMPFFGLKLTIISGAALDMVLGIILLKYTDKQFSRTRLPLAACILLIILVPVFTRFDPEKMSSAVYRLGAEFEKHDHKILFHKDGRTSTVHVTDRTDGFRSIKTNGKPDAGIYFDNNLISPDEPTMVLLAALPLFIYPDAKTVANIGIGSGLTTHTLLAWPGITHVDTIEIEPAMVEGAAYFRPRVERAFSDPRSQIHIEDAKTFFSSHKKRYDLIISEPSNPWVSGVSSLFTDEFYAQIKSYLSENGMFVQWLQMYEINLQLVLSVLKSLDNNFSHYSLYATNNGDVIILAKSGPINSPGNSLFSDTNMKNELSMVGIHDIQDITIRFIANEMALKPLLKIYRPQVNSDYFPILDFKAPEARFKQENVLELIFLGANDLPVIQMLYPEFQTNVNTKSNKDDIFSVSKNRSTAVELYDYIMTRKSPDLDDAGVSSFSFLEYMAQNCMAYHYPDMWIKRLMDVATRTIPYLTPRETNEIWPRIVPDCRDSLSPFQEFWLGFVKGLGNRDATMAADNALELLKQREKLDLDQKKFLFGGLLLSLVTLDEYVAALKLWDQLISVLYPENNIPLNLELLYAISLSKIENNLVEK